MVIVLTGKEKSDRIKVAKAIVERYSIMNTDPKTLQRTSGYRPIDILSKRNQVKLIVSNLTGYNKTFLESETFKTHRLEGLDGIFGGDLLNKVEESLLNIHSNLLARSVLSFCSNKGNYVVVDFNEKEIEAFKPQIRIIDITAINHEDNDAIDSHLNQLFKTYGTTDFDG